MDGMRSCMRVAPCAPRTKLICLLKVQDTPALAAALLTVLLPIACTGCALRMTRGCDRGSTAGSS